LTTISGEHLADPRTTGEDAHVATVDPLLKLIEAQRADGLKLEPQKPPALVFGATSRPLSMPPLGPELIEKFLSELVSADQLSRLRETGALRGHYQAERLGGFQIAAQTSSEGVTVAFRPGAPVSGEPPAHAAPSDQAELVEPPRAPEPPPAPAVEVVARRSPAASTALDELLWRVVVEHASDLIVSAGNNTAIRMSGDVAELPGTRFTDEQILGALGHVLTPPRQKELEKQGNVDLAYELRDTAGGRPRRFRVNVFRQIGGLAAAFRPIWDDVPTFEQLNLPDSLRQLAEFPHGLVLMTGPTGSGKSTTLAVLLEHINRTRARHVITLEDPIEYIYARKRSIVHQREVGIHVDSFATGLRAALRESPDVILVGEMRDLDTIGAAITAAETGHLVLSTLHSGSATMAIDRIVDVFPEYQQSQIRTQLADVLRAVVTQRLIPSTNPRKRVPAVEILRVNYAIANLIREHKNHQITSQIQTGREDGMVPMDRSLAELVRGGKISREVAMRSSNDPRHLKGMLEA
jgi:twitching motility protein PilT